MSLGSVNDSIGLRSILTANMLNFISYVMFRGSAIPAFPAFSKDKRLPF
jgi:hypothetical protein